MGLDGVEGTGIYFGTDRARPDLLEQRREGEHVWAVIASYVVSEDVVKRAAAGGQVNLDAENLAYTGLGCFVCQQPYSPRLTFRRCKGEPKA